MQPLSVDEFSNKLKSHLSHFGAVKVKGEIGKITASRLGHTYFDLKSETATLNCIAWASSNVSVNTGSAIVDVQKMDYYPSYGKSSAIVSKVSMDEEVIPVIAQKKALLLESLQKEGILTREKLRLPDNPMHICIVTSQNSAAAHDMAEGIQTRWPHLNVTWLDVQVQGLSAASCISESIRKAVNLKPDVIICGRGGGSESDLDVFNEEIVVRAFYNTLVPIISAVGHETDFCLCDHVADVRAKTPTAAIELAIPVTYSARCNELAELKSALSRSMTHMLEEQTKKLNQLTNFFSHTVKMFFETRERDLSSLQNRLRHSMQQGISKQSNRLNDAQKSCKHHISTLFRNQSMNLAHLEKQLENLSHKSTLKRGFALVTDATPHSNKIVKSSQDMRASESFYVHFADGKVLVTVNRINE